ncbi:RedV protein [Actinomadura bangladeshensis]|uniref:RedV protein n=1 Tax=Actinomadura bangladeshensis TaxID=453573 RepID=A0A4R4P0D2_9ACTN|nr:RedV protein [Actinomadura bangladeshensis]TDC14944.1 RedV protein [Actinomadura bangladeshensis]
MTAQTPPRIAAPAFADALSAALDVAVLSPSSHNCQPWCLARMVSAPARGAAAGLLGSTGDGHVLVLAIDRERSLGALPAHALEMELSCGLYWRLLQRALAAQGWTVARARTLARGASPSGLGLPGSWEPLRVAEFRRGGDPDGTLDDLRALARRRRTNRAPFRPDPVDPALLAALARHRGDGLPVLVRHLRSWPERARFARFVAEHGGRDFAHGGAWRETHSFLRWSAGAADGFTLEHLFGPLPAYGRWARRLALAPPAMAALSRVGYPRLLAGRLAAVVRRSPVIVLMGLPVAEPGLPDTLAAASALADYWLDATAAGLVLHPVSIVIQHTDLRPALQRRFGMPGRVFFAARLGRPAAAFPASPRRAPAAAFRAL